MNKLELINSIHNAEGLSHEERAYLVSLVNTSKKYGLVWEDKLEKVEEDLRTQLPVLREDKELAIINGEQYPNHILIEGDNLHALTALSFTHKGKIDVIYIDPPYNTGAKNWKYNNDYVDKNDVFRHSKWISFMYKRLLIAKELLTSKGSLIVAIDENEQANLGVLLQEIFPNYEHHCVTIVHNPRGVQGTNFSYTHEYAFFVFPKGAKIIGDRRIDEREIDWRNLRDNGGESLRTDARNCFYPIIINPLTSDVVKFGDVTDNDIHPKANVIIDDLVHIYPVDKNNVERKWRYAHQSVDKVKQLLRAKKVKGIWQIEIGKDFGTYRTVWQDPKYDANEYGTKLINRMISNCDFDFPKSFYNVYDCVYAVAANNKNAIILDYFAGSGTTGHVVMELNKDGGNRQCILATCSENNIAQGITYPRIKSAITGKYEGSGEEVSPLKGNLRFYKADFVPSAKTEKNRRELTALSTELLQIKENCYTDVTRSVGIDSLDCMITTNGQGKYMVVIYYSRNIDTIIKQVTNWIQNLNNATEKIKLYAFCPDTDVLINEFAPIANIVDCIPLPETIYNAYRATFKAIKIK